MKVSREQVAENRRRILDAAARLFRERGFEGVTVAEVMKAAGLTHGGFYGHFESKDDLVAQTLAHAVTPAGEAPSDIAAYAEAYLRPQHRDNLGGGCAFAALGPETARGSGEGRHVMTRALRGQLDRLAAAAPGHNEAERRRAAIAQWSAMVGAIILARLSDDPQLSDEILRETRAALDDQAAKAAS